MACGLAGGLLELVIYRILQGAFGATLAPTAQAIVLDSYPRERQAGATAIFGMGVVLGPILAPTLGGYLSEIYNWRWVFFMIVPPGMACIAGIWLFIHDRRDPSPLRFDWTGFIALAVAIGCLQLLLDRGESQAWFESTEIILECALAVAALYIFIAHTMTTPQPFLRPRLLVGSQFCHRPVDYPDIWHVECNTYGVITDFIARSDGVSRHHHRFTVRGARRWHAAWLSDHFFCESP